MDRGLQHDCLVHLHPFPALLRSGDAIVIAVPVLDDEALARAAESRQQPVNAPAVDQRQRGGLQAGVPGTSPRRAEKDPGLVTGQDIVLGRQGQAPRCRHRSCRRSPDPVLRQGIEGLSRPGDMARVAGRVRGRCRPGRPQPVLGFRPEVVSPFEDILRSSGRCPPEHDSARTAFEPAVDCGAVMDHAVEQGAERPDPAARRSCRAFRRGHALPGRDERFEHCREVPCRARADPVQDLRPFRPQAAVPVRSGKDAVLCRVSLQPLQHRGQHPGAETVRPGLRAPARGPGGPTRAQAPVPRLNQ